MIVTVTKNKMATTVYHVEEKILVSVYKGRVDIELAMEQTEKLLEFYKMNEVKGRIMDIRQLYGSFAKLIEYYKNAFSIAVDSGLSCISYVVSDDLLAQNLILKLETIAHSFKTEAKIFLHQKSYFNFISSSSNCSLEIGEGESIITSLPELFLGNAI